MRASLSMVRVDSPLPISSSLLTSRTGVAGGRAPNTLSARSAKSACTSPAFMSNTPGPLSRPFATRNGIDSNVPSGQTVSQWPRRSCSGAPRVRGMGMRQQQTAVAHPWPPGRVVPGDSQLACQQVEGGALRLRL